MFRLFNYVDKLCGFVAWICKS